MSTQNTENGFIGPVVDIRAIEGEGQAYERNRQRESQSYNGWTNYETWLVNVHLDNDEGSYHDREALVAEAYDEAKEAHEDGTCHHVRFGMSSTLAECAAYRLSKSLQESVESNAPEGESGLYADLMTAALGSVNWRELADHYVSDFEPDEDEDEDDEDTDLGDEIWPDDGTY